LEEACLEGCSPIILFMPAFGVGWPGLAQQKIEL
jgi:hypothetical protein